MERLYTGPQADSELVEHMRACNAKGPLVVQIAKLFPKSDCSAFDAFGRVYSGTVRPGDKVPPALSAPFVGVADFIRTLTLGHHCAFARGACCWMACAAR